jgi:hypothetical protein
MLIGTPPALGAEQMSHAFKISAGGLGFVGGRNWSHAEERPFLRDGVAVGKEECFEN